MTRLSKNFSSHEFSKLEWTALNDSIKTNIELLIEHTLQPLRSALRCPVHVRHSIDSTRKGARYGAMSRTTFEDGTGVLISVRHRLDYVSLGLYIAHHIPTVKFTTLFINCSPMIFIEYHHHSNRRNILPSEYQIPPRNIFTQDGDSKRSLSTESTRLIQKEKEKVLTVSSTKEPAWLGVAKSEMQKGVREDKSKTGNNADVLKYHAATRWYAKGDDIPWCSSFAHWCMLQAGITGLNVTFGARTFSTLHTPDNGLFEISKEKNKFYLGSVIVINWQRHLSVTENWKGHVAFLVSVSSDLKTCLALGGNQADRVKYQDTK